jgi:hypothetical protein
MNEDYLETTPSHDFIIKMFNSKYIKRDDWKEQKYLNNDFDDNDYNDYNDGISNNNYNDVQLMLEPCLYSDKKYCKFQLDDYSIDVIDNIYLEMDAPNFENKYDLLQMVIKLSVGGSVIYDSTLLTCIFNQIASSKNIEEYEDKIRIPILNFDTYYDKKHDMRGFPIKHLQWHAVKIILYYPNNDLFRLIINGKQYENDIMIMIRNNRYDNIVLINTIFKEELNKLNKYILSLNLINKFILIFIEENEYNEENIFTYTPIINKIILNCDKQDVLDFTDDDLLDIEIFGIKIYVLPMCSEFSDWESIREVYRNPIKNLTGNGINFSKIDNTYLQIEFENNYYNKDNYKINFISVSLNITRMMSGMMGLAFGS